MKNKVLIAIKNFYPITSASGNLLKKLTDVLGKKDDITVLTRIHEEDLKLEENINGTNIHRLRTRLSLFENNNKKGNIIKKNLKYIRYLLKQISFSNYSKKDVKLLENEIINMIDNKNIDIVMPITLEEIIATLRVNKKRKIKIVPYLFEVIPVYESKGIFIPFYNIRKNKINKIKNELYRNSQKIFVLPVLEKYFDDVNNKVILTEHPMVIDDTIKENKIKDKIIVTYAGGLDLKIRNPESILKILKKINNKYKIKDIYFKFFSYGNCQNMLSEFSKEYNWFESCGKVSPDVAHEELKNSNIIITIGNNNSNLIPSKLFDCISTGKPIIHFYYSDTDKYIEYLKKYKFSKCIDLNNNSEYNAKEVYQFILDNANKNINFNEIKQRYEECTPEYVANIINNELKKL